MVTYQFTIEDRRLNDDGTLTEYNRSGYVVHNTVYVHLCSVNQIPAERKHAKPARAAPVLRAKGDTIRLHRSCDNEVFRRQIH